MSAVTRGSVRSSAASSGNSTGASGRSSATATGRSSAANSGKPSAATSGKSSAATSGQTSGQGSLNSGSARRSTSTGRTAVNGSIISQQSTMSPASEIKRSSVASIPSPLQDADHKTSGKSSGRSSSISRRPSGPESLYTPTPESEELRATLLMDQVRSSLDRAARTSGNTGGSARSSRSGRKSSSGIAPGGSFITAVQDERSSLRTFQGPGSVSGRTSTGMTSDTSTNVSSFSGSGSLPGFTSQYDPSGATVISGSGGTSFSSGDPSGVTAQSVYSASQRGSTLGGTGATSYGTSGYSQPISILRNSGQSSGYQSNHTRGSQGVSFQLPENSFATQQSSFSRGGSASGPSGPSAYSGSIPSTGYSGSFATGTGGSVSGPSVQVPGSIPSGSGGSFSTGPSGGSISGYPNSGIQMSGSMPPSGSDQSYMTGTGGRMSGRSGSMPISGPYPPSGTGGSFATETGGISGRSGSTQMTGMMPFSGTDGSYVTGTGASSGRSGSMAISGAFPPSGTGGSFSTGTGGSMSGRSGSMPISGPYPPSGTGGSFGTGTGGNLSGRSGSTQMPGMLPLSGMDGSYVTGSGASLSGQSGSMSMPGSLPVTGATGSYGTGTGGSISGPTMISTYYSGSGSIPSGGTVGSFAVPSGGSISAVPARYTTQSYRSSQQTSFSRGSTSPTGLTGSFSVPLGSMPPGSMTTSGPTFPGGSFAASNMGGSMSGPSGGTFQMPSFGERGSVQQDFRASLGTGPRGSMQSEGMRSSAAGSGMLLVPGSFSQPGGSISGGTGGTGRTSMAPSIVSRQSTVARKSTTSRPTTLRFSESTTSQPGSQRRSTTSKSSTRRSTSSSRRSSSRGQDEKTEAIIEEVSEATETEPDRPSSAVEEQVRSTLTGLQLAEDSLIDDPWVQGIPSVSVARPSLRGSRASLGTPSTAQPETGRPSGSGGSLSVAPEVVRQSTVAEARLSSIPENLTTSERRSTAPSLTATSISAPSGTTNAQRLSSVSAGTARPSSLGEARPTMTSHLTAPSERRSTAPSANTNIRTSSISEAQRSTLESNATCPMPETPPADERGSATGRPINMTHRAFCRPGLSPCAVVPRKKSSVKKSSVHGEMRGSLPRDSLALKRTTTLKHTTITSGAEIIDTVEEEDEEVTEEVAPEYFPEKIYRGVMIFAFGGYDGISFNQETCRQVLRYDLASETWDVVGEMPCVRIYPAVVTYGDHIYIIGGANADCSSSMMSPDRGPSNQMFRYTPSSNSWLECPPMNYKRMHLAAAAAFGMILVFAH
ncbi:uncharacterized transmembrane protein DDB_G0289901-like isoform X2 [Paramacrobiotus metropolitanus]|uniref:uncharacterized transmembrane protein DDB_G0289901-like isoform X2 n=1 Tax=Paramacrobiotus metropolitanus TaxID=2943436 RepID=UPI002445D3AB|nr:uncharacterized transmembrane protein DDB_G0289901-like isoform X2 [Paramacrobiotus metropolitanus]